MTPENTHKTDSSSCDVKVDCIAFDLCGVFLPLFGVTKKLDLNPRFCSFHGICCHWGNILLDRVMMLWKWAVLVHMSHRSSLYWGFFTHYVHIILHWLFLIILTVHIQNVTGKTHMSGRPFARLTNNHSSVSCSPCGCGNVSKRSPVQNGRM